MLTPTLNMRTSEIWPGENLAHRVTDVSMTRFVNFDDFTFQVYFQVCRLFDISLYKGQIGFRHSTGVSYGTTVEIPEKYELKLKYHLFGDNFEVKIFNFLKATFDNRQ